MAKLTERQKKNIVTAYAAGGISQRDLAVKYGVSESTVYKILKSREGDFTEKVMTFKKEEERKAFASMADYFSSERTKAQGLIRKLLDIPDELIEASSLRDRVGAARYIKDMFTEQNDAGSDAKNALDELCSAIRSVGDKDG